LNLFMCVPMMVRLPLEGKILGSAALAAGLLGCKTSAPGFLAGVSRANLGIPASSIVSDATPSQHASVQHGGSTARSTSSSSSLAAMLGSAAATATLTLRKTNATRLRSGTGSRVAALAQKGSVETFLIEGDVDVAKLSMKCASIAGYMDLSTIVFFSLGVSEEVISSAAGGALGLHGACPVFIVDSYGIIGWNEEKKKNVELMEEGRGKEYGGVGGNGGKGVVVVAFRGPAFTTATGEEQICSPGESHMLICDDEASYQEAKSGAIYGGMAKKCFKMDSSTGALQQVSSFSVSGTLTSAVSTFSGIAADAAAAIVASMPDAAKGVKAAGYFPCFMRGVNRYDRDGAEPAEFMVSGMRKTRLFGMFAHGELGPPGGSVFVGGEEVGGSVAETPVDKHSMVSVLALLQERS